MKFLNLNPWDSTLVKLNELFNERKYKSIKKLIEEEVMNNNFMFKEEKARIINTYCINVRLYFLFNKWIHKWRLRKTKFNYINSTTLSEFTPITEIPDNNKFEIRDDTNIYTFDYHEIIAVIKNALENVDYMYPEPKYPFNPYNNKKLTKAQLVLIYDKLEFYTQNTKKKLPTSLILFKRNQFNITNFFFNNFNYLSYHGIKCYVNDLSNTAWYDIFEEFVIFYSLEERFCIECFKKLPNYREDFTKVIIDYLMETNSTQLISSLYSRSYNRFKKLCEYYELKKKKHEICTKHRKIFRKRKGFKFKLNLITEHSTIFNFLDRDIDITNFKFTANTDSSTTSRMRVPHRKRKRKRRINSYN